MMTCDDMLWWYAITICYDDMLWWHATMTCHALLRCYDNMLRWQDMLWWDAMMTWYDELTCFDDMLWRHDMMTYYDDMILRRRRRRVRRRRREWRCPTKNKNPTLRMWGKKKEDKDCTLKMLFFSLKIVRASGEAILGTQRYFQSLIPKDL